MHDSTTDASVDFAGTAFFEKTYREALSLVEEACDYLEGPVKQERTGLDVNQSLHLTGATMRLTARLTQLMAWMYVQRAVHVGEIDRLAAITSEHRLGPRRICLDDKVGPTETLPPRLQDLMQRSERLYRRVARLDDMLAGDAA